MCALTSGYQFRAATQEDIPSLLDLYNQYWKAMTGITKFTPEDFDTIFSTPGFEMGSSTSCVGSTGAEVSLPHWTTASATPNRTTGIANCRTTPLLSGYTCPPG